MNLKRLVFSLLFIGFFAGITQAQGSKLKRAKSYMEKLNYTGAIELYNQILEKNDNSEAKINLAACYLKVNDPVNAEYWYGQVVRLPEAEPIHRLYYGQMLQRNGKCDLAKEWYEKYVEEVPDDLRGQYLVKACDYEDELMTKNAGIYEITHLDINSNLDDFSPAIYGDGLVFASERDRGTAVKREHCWTGNPFNELYYVDLNATEGSGDEGNVCTTYAPGNPDKFSKDLNSKFHDAAVSFSEDEQQIFFTRNNYLGGKTGKSDDGIIKLKVYSATVSGENDFKNVEGLPFNSDEYSVAHPTLTPDGNRLFFASDMPGGFGGMDLYVSEQENGRWGPPLNLGPSVNTEGNEIFPFYQKDKRLYFSSDGQIGLGGLDIYYMDDKDDGEWGMIENMGYPINTISDDFGVVFNDEGVSGFFSSDRDGGSGRDDIYSFCKTASPVELLVYDEETKEPIQGAEVINDCTGIAHTTGADGKVILDMKMNECCNFAASKEEYEDNTKQGCTTDITLGERVFVEIPLNRAAKFELEGVVYDSSTGLPLEGALVTLVNDCEGEDPDPITTDASGRYYFELDKECCYTVKASKENYFGSPIEDQCTTGLTEPTTLKADLNLQPATTTAVNGSTPIDQPYYSENGDIIPVDDPRHPDYGTRGGVVTDYPSSSLPCDIYKDTDRGMFIDRSTNEPFDGECGGTTYRNGVAGGSSYTSTSTTDYTPSSSSGGTTTTVFNKETGTSSTVFEPGPTEYADNNVGYLLHIYYDFDQSYVRPESEEELQKLCTMMANNSDLVVEIASHTDSRGSNSYNNRLSQRRAESVVRWLCSNCDIDKERLIPRGYGEDKNVNDCANNVPCSEQEHQLNRRTEFRVIGCLSCYDKEAKLSQPKNNPRLDPCEGCPF